MSFAMRVVTILAAAMLGISAIASAQGRGPGQSKARSSVTPKLGVVASSDATALAQALTGAGVVISNATLRGAPQASGTFSGAAGSIGIDAGVVLSTGRVSDVAGANDIDATATNFGLAGDSQLNELAAPNRTFDAVSLEFDVTTAQSTIGVRFVFASEEYNEFVGSPYHDVVAIFVNGVNCANIGGRPVGVNSINAELNPALFVDNTGKTRDTEMDGLTAPLECVAAVTPNAPNRVRIAIADTSDGSLDTAIFVAAGGVHAPGNGSPTTTSYIARIVEYYVPEYNHYFLTAIPGEIDAIDNGLLGGWFRTGLGFNVFLPGAPNTAPICRFFSAAFGQKSSHFYTSYAPECAFLKGDPNWQYEGDVYSVILPTDSGGCPAGAQPLYRMYNNREGDAPAHRYTIDLQVRDLMVANGWIPEGYGIGVISCVPK